MAFGLIGSRWFVAGTESTPAVIECVKRWKVAQCIPCLLLHVHSGTYLLKVANNLYDVIDDNHQADYSLQYNLQFNGIRLWKT